MEDNGQTDRRGLLVDGCLRVKGTRPGEVFAIGDCAVSGSPPTAQVAYQQGKYLGRMFRLGAAHTISDPQCDGFKYCHQGSMAYILVHQYRCFMFFKHCGLTMDGYVLEYSPNSVSFRGSCGY
ncbi:unnamed protein product [Polarella glacialis]|uniref:Uncharacterized protein n=1 Tax=Polarella glacialis TaxID=89957 RepID=A0A813DNZ6_POLGL|nr:unnamed protein product [Polarella glacialis]